MLRRADASKAELARQSPVSHDQQHLWTSWTVIEYAVAFRVVCNPSLLASKASIEFFSFSASEMYDDI